MATDYSWILQDPNIRRSLETELADLPSRDYQAVIDRYLTQAKQLDTAIAKSGSAAGLFDVFAGRSGVPGGAIAQNRILASRQFSNLSPHDKAAFNQNIANLYAANKNRGILSLPSITGNPFKDAKSVYKSDQANVGRAVEAMQPLVEHALRNNPATLVAGADKQAADALGWDWLQHMTGKTEQTFERTSNKAAGFQEVFERQLAERMQAGESLTQAINNARLEADRAHARTNSNQDIQEGINRGEYTVTQQGDVVDRYGNTVLGKGLAQRGATALGAASVVFPWLAPFAAAANTATAYRHGVPAGRALAQGVGQYYAGELGGKYGGQLGGQLGGATGASIGRAAGAGAARGGVAGYASGLRGGDLAESVALGGLSGGLGQWAGMKGSNPFLSNLYRGAATGAVQGYRQGDLGQGIQQGVLSGGLSGAGGLLAQQTGVRQLAGAPSFAYQQWLRSRRS